MTRLSLAFALASAALLLVARPGLAAGAEEADSVLDFTVKDIDGKTVDLETFKGDVLLIVNTASKCGYTPQYEGMQALYEKYGDRGFKVLAFPANEFGGQEPGTDPQIKEFCSSTYGVEFPLFSKIVVKGKGIHPLYRYLTGAGTNPEFGGEIRWNFTKFLVGRDGEVLARFEPGTAPESEELVGAVEEALGRGE